MEQHNLEKATQIYYYLLKEGELSFENNKELYMFYSENEVKSLVDILAKETDVNIEKYNQVIYLTPNEENEVLGIKDIELQKVISSDARKIDFYISQYMILMLLNIFYSGRGNHIKSRDFISVSEFEEILTKKLEFVKSKDNIEEQEQEVMFNITAIYEHWSALPIDELNKRKTKYGYIRSVCGFLREQNLILFDVVEEDIRPTNKLTHLMSYSFLNKNRQESIYQLLGIDK